MKTIVRNGVSLWLFDDDEKVDFGPQRTFVGDPLHLIIDDCSSSNSKLIEGVSAPDDWSGCKYLFDGVRWSLNPNWVDPS